MQHQSRGISRSFVAVPNDQVATDQYRTAGYVEIGPTSVLGFYALASAFVMLEDLPAELSKRYPRQIPVTRLGRLAIRADMQGQGLGQLLLTDAVIRARAAAQSVGSAGVIVDAKGDDAARFYRGYGFRPCGDTPLKLFLPM